MTKEQLRNIIFLLSFSFLSVIAFFIIINQLLLSSQTKDVILSNAKTAIKVQEKLFTSFMHKTTDQLNSLNTSTYFQEFLDTRASKKVVQKYFLGLAQSDSSIMQVRFIGQNGLEQIRVDRKDINTPAKLIPEDKLQDKSLRDYFILSKQKPANTKWLSNIDLNIEHTEVEKPFKPTLRAILPLRHANDFKGVLVINYFMQPLLDDISNIPLYDVIIMDKNTDTLVHYDNTKSWSAYSSQKNNLKHLFPEQYNAMLENNFFSSEDLVTAKLNIPFGQDLFSVLTLKKEFLQASRDKTVKRIAVELILLAFTALGVGIFLAKHLQTVFNENEDIRKQKKIFNDTFDNAAVGIAHIGLDGRWIRINKILSTILGYSEDELLTLTFQEVTYPEDLETDLKYLNKTLLGQIDSYTIEKRYLRKDGSLFWARLTISLIRDQNGSPEYFISIIDDISLRKKLQTNISAYVELIDTHIITSTTDLKGCITEVSEAFCKISGYTKDELIGEGHNILRHPDMPSELYEDLWKTIKDDKTWFGEIKNKTKDGSYYWVRATITPRFDDNNIKVGYTAIRQLITDKKALEETKLQLQKNVDELQKTQDVIVSQSRMAAIGEMLSMIAHQWRQPLATISSELNAMHISSQLGTLSLDDIGEQVEKTQGNIQALSSIINTFRNYYGSDNEADTMLLKEITDTAISLKDDHFKQNNIVLTTQFDRQAETLLYSKQLIQVLVNLMRNAIEALQKSTAEDKKIFLKTENKASQVIISLCDNGGGIDNEILDKTFEPYFSTKQNLNGKGLGLYTSKIIIENVIKGSINIQNNDQGVCVTMVLPSTEI